MGNYPFPARADGRLAGMTGGTGSARPQAPAFSGRVSVPDLFP